MKKQKSKKYADLISFPIKINRFSELARYCEERGLILLCEVINMPENQEAALMNFLIDNDILAEDDPLTKEEKS